MKGSEFIRRIQAHAKTSGLVCRVVEKRGKGSQVTLYLGDKLMIVGSPKGELKTGTLHAMLRQRGRDWPEATTQGDTPEAVLAEAADCLEEAVTAGIADGREIPLPLSALAGEGSPFCGPTFPAHRS